MPPTESATWAALVSERDIVMRNRTLEDDLATESGVCSDLLAVESAWRAGLETLLVGGLAASFAYLVGVALRGAVAGGAG